jgi:hypothetical protein
VIGDKQEMSIEALAASVAMIQTVADRSTIADMEV